MALKHIKNDILSAKRGFIVHQLTNKRILGTSLAKQIKSKHPRHYKDYKSAPLHLGNIIVTPIKERTWIVGIVTQEWHEQDKKCYTNYKALKDCLEELSLMLTTLHPEEHVLFPHSFGIEDWTTIEPLVEAYFPNAYVVQTA